MTRLCHWSKTEIFRVVSLLNMKYEKINFIQFLVFNYLPLETRVPRRGEVREGGRESILPGREGGTLN